MRVILIATGDIALPCLHHLLEHGPAPLALVTQPDRPAGRHRVLTAPAVKHAALAAGLTVFQPEKIGDIAEELAALDPDVLVVMAYGQLLRKNILTLPRLACINLHASLLPRHRGAACIQAAIDAGDAHTGITAMHVARELDAGDIIMEKSIAILPDETGGSLHDRLAQLAPPVLAETLKLLESGRAPRIPQDPAAATYIPKLEREDGRIDWSTGAVALERRIRAYDPWPGTYTTARDGQAARRLKILPPARVVARSLPPGSLVAENGALIVGCGVGSLEITTLQPDGGKRMSAEDYLRGHHPEHFE
jgi:methionyl-tRNA formyltransferase